MSALSPENADPISLLPDYQGARVSFNRNLLSRRTLTSVILSSLAAALTLLACVPLFSVLIMLIWRGGTRLIAGGMAIFTQLPPGGLDTGGGFGNAIVGTLLMVGIAAAISVPFGILAAIFLAEYGATSKVGTTVRFSAKVLTGLPSILAGVFAYAFLVDKSEGLIVQIAQWLTGLATWAHAPIVADPILWLRDVLSTFTGYSALAGGLALSLLMIPIVMLTAEEAIKMVPRKMKDAAIGLGCTPAQVTWRIIVPTAMPGILTGVMLAVARAAGETAPLIFTALASNNHWAIDKVKPYFHIVGRETESMAVFIFNSSSSPQDNLIDLAWAASLVLVFMVLVFNIGGQILSHRGKPGK